MKFCCKNFPSRGNNKIINFYDIRTNKVIITYYSRDREYATVHGRDLGSYIQYCPWCGKKLPKELSDEWYEILDKEYGIEDPIVDDRKKVPAEFWTDEWWIKRKL